MLTDPIVALATPPGRSAIALIRLSGIEVFEIADRVLDSFRAAPFRTARISPVRSVGKGEIIDQALYLTYAGPASFTGEDVVEIATHGGLLVPSEVLATLIDAGARLASPGEFTRRALEHGKIDLLQAEAIGDLVDATAPAQRRAALHQLDRGLSKRIQGLRDGVLELEGLVCYEIDFPEEDEGPVSPERIEAAITAVTEQMTALLSSASEGSRLREGALTVIAGRPNVGKSSLFNALLGNERAIVTAVPGTTRDAIEAHAVCDGFPFRLIDTAGLREGSDEVERLGVEVSWRYLAGADLVLFCIEAARGISGEERAFLAQVRCPVILVRTKADACEDADTVSVTVDGASGTVTASAQSGTGLDVLRSVLARVAFTSLASSADIAPLVTRERHRTSLERALRELTEFREARRRGIETAIATAHLHDAVAALDDIIGVVTPEDVLERVFGSFCIGK